MSPRPPGGSNDHPQPPAQSLHRNLDALDRSLSEAEAALAGIMAGETPELGTLEKVAAAKSGQSYPELTATNEALSASLKWSPRELDELLTDAQRAQLEEWHAAKRLSWTPGDILVVGVSASIGIFATLMDSQVDAAVRQRLEKLSDTPLLRQWERDATGLPIDYMGPGFGGRRHRTRSSGHDLGRPLAALRQIRDGVFHGYRHEDGVRRVVTTDRGAYTPIDSLEIALVMWAKHLVTDVVTKMSLPLPGWTWLCELPSTRLRELAIDMYGGAAPGEGLNLRSGLITPTMSALAIDAIIRPSVHARFFRDRGIGRLPFAETARLNELLLASHSLVGAACLGKTFALALGGEGPFALRHLNPAVIMRIGMLAAKVRANVRERAELAPASWDDLLMTTSSPWLLDEAARTEALCSDITTMP